MMLQSPGWPEPVTQQRALRILIVEDNPDDRDLIRQCLGDAESNGAEILHAESIGNALRILECAPVHLTLLDLGLPDNSGLQALERLRARTAGPVILVTGRESPTLLSETPSLHAFDLLQKNDLTPANLMRLVRLALAQWEAEARLRGAENRFHQVFERSPDAIFVHTDERVVFGNSAAAKMLGAESEAQLAGMSIWKILHPEGHAATRARLARLCAGETLPLQENRYLKFDGTSVEVEVALAPFELNGRIGIQASARDITERKAREFTLREAERFARSTIDAPLNKNICVLDENGTILTANQAWRAFAVENRAPHHAAYEGQNYLAVCDAAEDTDARSVSEGIRQVMRGEADHYEYEYPCHSPDEQRWFVVRVSRFVGDGPLRLVVAHENVTARKRAELATQRLARTYSLLSATNEALFRLDDENRLFQRVCQIAVEQGGLRLAAIRLIEPRTGWLRVVAVGGEPRSFFANALLSIHSDVSEGRKPTAVAAREGRTLVCNDCQSDAGFAPWHGAYGEAGLAATMSVPLRRQGKVVGLLSLYSGEKGWFDSNLVALFEKMAENLSFGLDGFVREKQRQTAVEALRTSVARFRTLTELSADWYWELDEAFRFVAVTPENVQSRASLVYRNPGKARWDRARTSLSDAQWATHRAELEAHKPFRDFEYALIDADGTWHHVSVCGAPIFDGEGRFLGYRGVAKDLTESKRAAQLRLLEHDAARELAAADSATAGLQAVLKAMCEALQWDFGRFWELDEASGEIEAGPVWHVPDAAIERYLAQFNRQRLPAGFGLIGQVCRTGEAVWIPDAQRDARVLQPDFFAVAGMHGVGIFPVFDRGRTIGVFVLARRAFREPDAQMREAVQAIGAQIGQILLRKRAEDDLRRFRAAIDVSEDLVLLVEPETLRYVDVNDAACRVLGYRRDELLAMGPLDVFSASREDLADAYRRLVAGDTVDTGTTGTYRRKDGSTLRVEAQRRAVASARGHVIVSVARDITQRALDEERLRRANERFEVVTRATLDVVWDWDLRSDTIWWNPNFNTVFGHAPEDFRSMILSFTGQIHPEDHNRVVESLLQVIDNRERNWSAEYRFRRADGSYAQVFNRAIVIGEDSAEPTRLIGAMADISERKAAEEKLAYMAQFDSLTGLPNRTVLHDRLQQSVAQGRRRERSVGVLFLDIDRFKLVNDTLGHHAGDCLIAEVAARLRTCVREGDTVGRISGDEFAVILDDMSKSDDVAMIARKILAAFDVPFALEGGEAFITVSIGASVFPVDGDDAEALLKNADAAMYSAKEGGRNRVAFYTAALNERSSARLRLSTELRHAIDRNEFVLHYQPKADLLTGNISGFEALLRWQHPSRGLVSPLEFIPVLEDTGMIVPVGEWVVRSVCEQLVQWKAAGLAPRPVAINLSIRQFQQKGFDTTIEALLAAAGIDPALIEFEVTESMLMLDAEETVRVLNALRARGLRLSVDDFGTGYSSLAYLKRFPLDCLKIDRAFIRDCIADPDDAAIAVAIIGLAHTLGLKVVAEGVETEAQLNFLRARGCDEMQGYFFSRPLPAADCAQMLAGHRRLAIPARSDADGAGDRTAVVLVVDDYTYDLELMRETLEPAGFRVLLANGPEAALEILALHPVDAVISDHSMPGMSGVKFLTGVRQLYPDVTRILVSGSGDMQAAPDGINKAGIHKYLSKNWDEARKCSEIREALSRKRCESIH